MQLSDAEKLILMMLSEIHEQLPIKNGVDVKFIKSAIHSGNTWGLTWRFTGIFHDKQDTPPAVDEVCKILEMWDVIESSYDELLEEDKKRVLSEAAPYDPVFTGFDGNGDAEQMSIASFLIDDLNLFLRFRGRDLNSHMPMSLDGSRRMLAVFSPLQPSLTHRSLSTTEIVLILKQRAHPEYRNEQTSTARPQ